MTTAHDIERALAKKFAAPEYAFLLQVRNGTGYQRTVRTADAIAFSLYPSRGLTITGFEIKVSKSDWKRELENPDKAEDIARFCHTWNIVAPKDVVPIDELPMNWGLLELHPSGVLRSKKAAVLREPEPLTPLMIASIMRNISTGMIPRSSIQAQITASVDREREVSEREVDRRTKGYTELKKRIEDFEKASGVHIEDWNAGRIGDAVRTVMYQRTDPESCIRQLEHVQEQVQRVDRELRAAIASLSETAGSELAS